MKITFIQQSETVLAFIEENPRCRVVGKNSYEALGKLVINNPNEFGVEIDDTAVVKKKFRFHLP